MKLRTKIGLITLLASFAVPFFLGFFLGPILGSEEQTYFENVLGSAKVFHMFFVAGISVGAVLIFITKVPEALCICFGVALYYGTIFLGGFVRDLLDAPEATPTHYGMAFVYVALVCYIFWLKKFKQECE